MSSAKRPNRKREVAGQRDTLPGYGRWLMFCSGMLVPASGGQAAGVLKKNSLRGPSQSRLNDPGSTVPPGTAAAAGLTFRAIPGPCPRIHRARLGLFDGVSCVQEVPDATWRPPQRQICTTAGGRRKWRLLLYRRIGDGTQRLPPRHKWSLMPSLAEIFPLSDDPVCLSV